MTDRPPAAESGTSAPGEAGREALARDVDYLRRWALRATRLIAAGQEATHLDAAAERVLASLLSASPASETRDYAAVDRLVHVPYERRDDAWHGAMAAALPGEYQPPASETPGPGEGDLRGEGRDDG